jgi:hypothetical protein
MSITSSISHYHNYKSIPVIQNPSHISSGKKHFTGHNYITTLVGAINSSDGSEIRFLFLSSCSPQIINLVKNARFQSVINTISIRQTSTPYSISGGQ